MHHPNEDEFLTFLFVKIDLTLPSDHPDRSIDTAEIGKKWNETGRRETRGMKSRRSVKSYGVLLRAGELVEFSGHGSRRKRERENRCVTSGGQHLRAAASQTPYYSFR